MFQRGFQILENSRNKNQLLYLENSKHTFALAKSTRLKKKYNATKLNFDLIKNHHSPPVFLSIPRDDDPLTIMAEGTAGA